MHWVGPRRFATLVTQLRDEGADAARTGRPWNGPLENRVLLATYRRTGPDTVRGHRRDFQTITYPPDGHAGALPVSGRGRHAMVKLRVCLARACTARRAPPGT